MTTVVETLTTLAKRFDQMADIAQGNRSTRARKDAAHLRFVRDCVNTGVMTSDEAWNWCDAAAGQLTTDRQQLTRKAKP